MFKYIKMPLYIDMVCYLFYLIDGAVYSKMMCLDLINRRTLICAVNQDAEKLFQKTVEVDRLIDMLREANANEVSSSALFVLALFSRKPIGNYVFFFVFVNSFRSLWLKMSLLSMRAFGYDLQQELIPANLRMIKHGF